MLTVFDKQNQISVKNNKLKKRTEDFCPKLKYSFLRNRRNFIENLFGPEIFRKSVPFRKHFELKKNNQNKKIDKQKKK